MPKQIGVAHVPSLLDLRARRHSARPAAPTPEQVSGGTGTVLSGCVASRTSFSPARRSGNGDASDVGRQ